MKQYIYILFLSIMLAGSACSRTMDQDRPKLRQEEQHHGDSLSERISMEELPAPIKEGINNDILFQGLNISNIVRITENDYTYYDMTFRDVDGQLIMVFYAVSYTHLRAH